MISVQLARALRDSGLRWDPAPGDRFIVADRGIDDEVFTLSDMTIDVHDFPSGRVIGFNGTVEWALDSVEMGHSLWLPSETHLRERLGGTFRSLSGRDGRWQVAIEVSGTTRTFATGDAAESYGRALYYLITGTEPPM